MKRQFKVVVLVLLGILIVLQFFQPERNAGTTDQENDFLMAASVPDNLATIFKSACYDCHSNHTEYGWYSHISPVSWYLDKHIREGKKELNLSEFGTLDKVGKIGVLTDIYDVLDAGTMPLQSYMLLHERARIDKKDVEAICDWTELEAMRIMKR